MKMIISLASPQMQNKEQNFQIFKVAIPFRYSLISSYPLRIPKMAAVSIQTWKIGYFSRRVALL